MLVAARTLALRIYSKCISRAFAGAADRNKGDVFRYLYRWIPSGSPELRLLEVASGTGQHAAFMAPQIEHLKVWIPSDVSSTSIDRDIPAWTDGISSVAPPIRVDASHPRWTDVALSALAGDDGESSKAPTESTEQFDVILACNVTHISPFAATSGLFAGAGDALRPGGRLCIYGPFKLAGTFTTESNRAFDGKLRERCDEWGLRDLEALDACARAAGLGRIAAEPMPANNFFCVWEKPAPASTSGALTAGASSGAGATHPASKETTSVGTGVTGDQSEHASGASASKGEHATEASASRGWRLEQVPGVFAVARIHETEGEGEGAGGVGSVGPADLAALLGRGASSEGSAGFVSATRTPEELSVVCPEAVLADLLAGRSKAAGGKGGESGASAVTAGESSAAPEEDRVEGGWAMLRVAGYLDFALIGVLASVVGPLKDAGVSVFVSSTYDTDYVLVKGEALGRAVEALRVAGHDVRLCNEE